MYYHIKERQASNHHVGEAVEADCEKKKADQCLPPRTFRGWFMKASSRWCRSSQITIPPLQKKRAQQDYIIKRAPVEPQTVTNNVENTMEIWHKKLHQVDKETVFNWLLLGAIGDQSSEFNVRQIPKKGKGVSIRSVTLTVIAALCPGTAALVFSVRRLLFLTAVIIFSSSTRRLLTALFWYLSPDWEICCQLVFLMILSGVSALDLDGMGTSGPTLGYAAAPYHQH